MKIRPYLLIIFFSLMFFQCKIEKKQKGFGLKDTSININEDSLMIVSLLRSVIKEKKWEEYCSFEYDAFIQKNEVVGSFSNFYVNDVKFLITREDSLIKSKKKCFLHIPKSFYGSDSTQVNIYFKYGKDYGVVKSVYKPIRKSTLNYWKLINYDAIIE